MGCSRFGIARASCEYFALLTLAVLLGGCASSGPRTWGGDATFTPDAQRVRSAAIEAFSSPRVWLPLAGAALLQIDGWDQRISDWASDQTPVFGSKQNAARWSDHLREVSSMSYLATALATPGPQDWGDLLRDKSAGLAVGLGAMLVTGVTTSALKDVTGRTRPRGGSTKSLPSGHASHAAVSMDLARDNLRYIDMGEGTRRALGLGLDVVTIGTAWARVEADAHYPADTLVGMALGSLVGAFFRAAFLEPSVAGRMTLTAVPLRDGLELQFEVRY
jgi:membrane-associated phospholipid phosphatase